MTEEAEERGRRRRRQKKEGGDRGSRGRRAATEEAGECYIGSLPSLRPLLRRPPLSAGAACWRSAPAASSRHVTALLPFIISPVSRWRRLVQSAELRSLGDACVM